MKTYFTNFVLLLLLACANLAQAQQNTIKNVSSTLQGGTEWVRIELAKPLKTLPSSFSTQTPARIAIDFDNARNALGRTTLEMNQGNLRSATVIEANQRTRVVLNLKQAASYHAQTQGRFLLIKLDPASAVTAQSEAPAIPSPQREDLALRDIDFRRGIEGAGRIVVDLPTNEVGVDIRQQGRAIVVEFLKTTLPEGLRRRMDVADFGTPVQTIAVSQLSDRVRMVVEPIGAWEQSAYQTSRQFVLELRPQKTDPGKLTQGSGYNGEKLSLNFQNIEVRALLQVIADFTNFNVVTSDSVSGSVTLRLKDVPWDQALDLILQAKGLGVRKTGNVLWIAPKDEINAKEKIELEAKAALQNIEPLRTQAFALNYAKAADMANQLAGGGSASASGGARILSTRGSVIAEPRTNQLFVTDISAKLEQVQQLISKVDIPVRQVLIEARIVEASDTFGKSLGVKLGSTDLRAQNGQLPGYSIGNRVAFGTNYGNVTATSGQGGVVDTSSAFVNLPAIGQNGYNPASFAISIFSASANRFLNLELSALEADGKGQVVSSPRVVTADQTKALIEQGTELPYQMATSSGATAVSFRKANLKLEVTPQITPEGSIILDLDVNKDSVGQSTAAGFAINTKHIKTQVLVDNGGTVVIGGIFELNESESENKVPLLGDIPVAGHLFKNRTRSSTKQEMLVFITPKLIVDRPSAP